MAWDKGTYRYMEPLARKNLVSRIRAICDEIFPNAFRGSGEYAFLVDHVCDTCARSGLDFEDLTLDVIRALACANPAPRLVSHAVILPIGLGYPWFDIAMDVKGCEPK